MPASTSRLEHPHKLPAVLDDAVVQSLKSRSLRIGDRATDDLWGSFLQDTHDAPQAA